MMFHFLEKKQMICKSMNRKSASIISIEKELAYLDSDMKYEFSLFQYVADEISYVSFDSEPDEDD